MTRQGEIYWVDAGPAAGPLLGGRRPFVVLQSDAVNASGIGTAVVCPLTSNIARVRVPGNVIVRAGEGGLRADSVANTSQVRAMDRALLERCTGILARERVREIIAGLNMLLTPRG